MQMKWIKYGATGILLLLTVWAGQNQFLENSELWSIMHSQLFGQLNHDSGALYFKPAFNFILRLLYFFDLDNRQHVMLARFVFSMAGVGLVVCYYLFSSKLYPNWQDRALAIFLLFASPVFTNNFYKVRSDILAAFFGFLLLLRLEKRADQISIRILQFDVVILACLLFLSTPKAIYLLIISAFFIWIRASQSSVFLRLRFLFIHFLLPPTFIIFAALIAIGDNIDDPYATAILYFFNSQKEFWHLSGNWSNVVTLLKQTPLQFACVLGLILAYLLKGREYRARSMFIPFTALPIAIIVWHAEKYPFFLAHLLPFLILPIPSLFILAKNRASTLRVVLLVSVLTHAIFGINRHNYYYSNKDQLTGQELASQTVKLFNDPLIFDATGILPRNRNVFGFAGPNDLGSKVFTLQKIELLEPDVIFFTAKFEYLTPDIYGVLARSYREVAPDIWFHKKHAGLDTAFLASSVFSFRSNFGFALRFD